jgi:hypothetical protein
MATKFLEEFEKHPVKATVLLILGLAVFVFVWLLVFNVWRNTCNGSSEKAHSKWAQSSNPSNCKSSESLVSESFANLGFSGKANTALQGQSILTETATRQDDRLQVKSSGSLA